MPWRRASSTCSNANGYGARFTGRGPKHGRMCSITSRCSTIRNASMLETGCCRPSSSNGSKKRKPKASRKLGAIHQNPPRQRPKIHCTTSGRQRQRQMPKKPSTCSSKCMSRNTRRLQSVCKRTVTKCCLSMTFQRRTGRAFGPAIPLSRPSGRSVIGPDDQKDACLVMECCT